MLDNLHDSCRHSRLPAVHGAIGLQFARLTVQLLSAYYLKERSATLCAAVKSEELWKKQ